jgi:hypothetical protein
MLTSARIREDLRPLEGLPWISALTRNEVRVEEQTLQMLATSTPVQQRARELLKVSAAV